ncbi:MAG: hypothetical protein R3F04_10950 [Lysobacteraceae bacterium]
MTEPTEYATIAPVLLGGPAAQLQVGRAGQIQAISAGALALLADEFTTLPTSLAQIPELQGFDPAADWTTDAVWQSPVDVGWRVSLAVDGESLWLLLPTRTLQALCARMPSGLRVARCRIPGCKVCRRPVSVCKVQRNWRKLPRG